MRQYNRIIQDGKLTVRKNEDRGKGERVLHKESSLAQADVCLYCPKPDCRGGGKCYEAQKRKRENGAAVE